MRRARKTVNLSAETWGRSSILKRNKPSLFHSLTPRQTAGNVFAGGFKAILTALLVGGILSVSSWAFAQGGGRNYTLLPSKLGYGDMPAPDLIELSDRTSNGTANVSVGGESWLTKMPEETTQVLSWETRAGKSYLIPALEIPAFILLLNGYDRLAYPNELTSDGKRVYETNPSTFWDHVVHGSWQVDKDPFGVNQLGHPYQGSIYYGFARSAGLNYWESLLYTNAGSLLWELGGENTPPSINDQIASGIAGSFFGEALFRMASLVLEDDDGKPGLWRELGATILSPSTGINRFSFGDRFKPVFPSRKPATSWRLRLGASLNSDPSDQGGSRTINRSETTADFSMRLRAPREARL